MNTTIGAVLLAAVLIVCLAAPVAWLVGIAYTLGQDRVIRWALRPPRHPKRKGDADGKT